MVGRGDFHPAEFVGIIVAALAINAFVYGVVLQFYGVTNWVSTGLIIGGVIFGLLSAGWLLVILQVKEFLSS